MTGTQKTVYEVKENKVTPVYLGIRQTLVYFVPVKARTHAGTCVAFTAVWSYHGNEKLAIKGAHRTKEAPGLNMEFKWSIVWRSRSWYHPSSSQEGASTC